MEWKENGGIRGAGWGGGTFVYIIRESEFYSKCKERPLKGFKPGSAIMQFILKKITGRCIEERLEEDEWGCQLKGR